MSLDAKQLKESLVRAGLEVYRSRASEVHVAERVRSHIMDSGVRVLLVGDGLEVRFVARTQRSDYPEVGDDELFARVRTLVGVAAQARGFAEITASSVDVKDPVDDSRTLDVWNEVTFSKPVSDVDAAIDAVRWALSVDRYVMP
ncbi:MAG: hypothetical protein K1X94_17480 [Sandaracinaceae bacterium]|nr:hypothetical protein [Sandaracinaceae bacterium]